MNALLSAFFWAAFAGAPACAATLPDLWAHATPRSRAEVRDFYWEVLAASYPDDMAARTDRELAQLNAYRRLAGCGPVRHDPVLRSRAEAAAGMLAANGRVSHTVDATWIGYSKEIAATVAESNLAGFQYAPRCGATDLFVFDGGTTNAAAVGHRAALLHSRSTTTGIGLAANPISAPPHFAVISVEPQTVVSGVAAADEFVAWPPAGFFPRGLMKSPSQNPTERFRWSFRPATTSFESDFSQAVVSASIGGRVIPVRDQRLTRGYPITWELDDIAFRGEDDVTVSIDISHAAVRGVPIEVHYSVTLIDENVAISEGVVPRTAVRNLSARGRGQPGDEGLIIGFVVSGDEPLRIALRSRGPSLELDDTEETPSSTNLRVYDSSGMPLIINTGWRDGNHWRLLQDIGLAPPSTAEAGIALVLPPGSYTASASGDRSGSVLLEVFAIDPDSTSTLSNLAIRGRVEWPLIAGFSVRSEVTAQLRIYGSRLRDFGVAEPAEKMGMDCYSNQTVVARLPLAETDVRPLSVEFGAGSYTAVLSGTPGVGLLELAVDIPRL